MESIATAMEISSIGGRNVALLIEKYLYENTSIQGDQKLKNEIGCMLPPESLSYIINKMSASILLIS